MAISSFAPVCPIRVLRALQPANSGDYHLLLAHDVAANAGAFKAWFGKFMNMTVIMDNSVIELGNAVDLEVIKKACEAVDVTTIVLPDVLLDGKATVESCSKAVETWSQDLQHIVKASGWQKRGFMYVPQGKTIQEFAWAAQALADHPAINFWGVPRNLVGQVGSRRDAIDIVHALNPSRKIHLLGFSDNLVDDVLSARSRHVVGIDSAVPLRVREDLNFYSDPGKRGTWWDDVEHSPQMDRNIETFKSWIQRS